MPPAYPSRATMAAELDCAESTIDELVKRGVLPKPRRLSTGCVRWCWAEVVLRLDSLKNGHGSESSDPFLKGIQNVIQEGRREPA
jgi:predicted DNA-binding transcriptional regulator AlpA